MNTDCDPGALTLWYNIFKTVIDRNAPVQQKRGKKKNNNNNNKKKTPHPWLFPELIREMKKKDQLKRNRQFDEYKKQRNHVSTQVEKAKRKYFSQLVNDKTKVSSIWKAINICTHKNRSYNTSAVNIPPDSLNDHFLSLPSRLLQSVMGNSDPDGYVSTSSLLDFCRERHGPTYAFHYLYSVFTK